MLPILLLVGFATHAGAPATDVQSAGSLQVVGYYPNPMKGALVERLPNGMVMAYGEDPTRYNNEHSVGTHVANLRDRHSLPKWGSLMLEPRLWDPQKRGWIQLAPVPECAGGNAFEHTLTPLPDNRILIAGGVCDMPRMRDDTTPRSEYRKLSLWNATTGKWESAPDLMHGRVFHSTSLLPNGSVMIIGGESDPALHAAPEEMVLSSVEAYADGKLIQMPSLNVARAKHTSTILANAGILVVGGFDKSGGALTSVEIWNPLRHSWSKAQPLTVARFNHSATLLSDGRVLVAGGIGSDGKALKSVEIWNPDSGQWNAGFDLPVGLNNHNAILLDDGNLLVAGGNPSSGQKTLVWMWEKSIGKWLPAGVSARAAVEDPKHRLTFAKNSDGSVHIFAVGSVMRWQRMTAPSLPASIPPAWMTRPSLTALNDGRVMVIGRVRQEGYLAPWVAHIWDPLANTWNAAGTLANDYGFASQAIQLRSGRILHLGLDAKNRLRCETWWANSKLWESCGDIQLAMVSEGIGLSLLEDGRAMAITATNEVHLFDESTKHWSAGSLLWNTDGMTWGAPIHLAHPLAILTDDSNKTFDVSADAAKFWTNLPGHLEGSVNIGGKIMDSESAATSGPPMLWDDANKRWAYVFPKGAFGKQAAMLADGCAISLSVREDRAAFFLFDGKTGTVKRLAAPITGIWHSDASMIVLNGDTVVLAGMPGDALQRFFFRKVSCAGFAPAEDDWALMPGVMYHPPAADRPAPINLPQADPTLLEQLMAYKWVGVVLSAVLGLYLLIRFALMPLLRRGARSVLSEEAAARLDKPVAKKVSWPIRLLLLTVAFFICVPLLRFAIVSYRVNAGSACAANPAACVDNKTGLLQGIPELAKDGAKPKIPCKYVGDWATTGKQNRMRRISLKDDGTYVMQGNRSVGDSSVYTGFWMVQGDKMVWRHSQTNTGEADINQILPENDSKFVLVEQNGWHTRFELIAPAVSTKCTP